MYSILKRVVILLCHLQGIIVAVISFFGCHIVNHTNRQQLQIRQRQPQIKTAQEKQRRVIFTVYLPIFFLEFDDVAMLSPHNSKICGKTS